MQLRFQDNQEAPENQRINEVLNFHDSQRDFAYQEINGLLNQRKIEEAWDRYKSLNNYEIVDEFPNNNFIQTTINTQEHPEKLLKTWNRLPPEALITGLVETLQSSDAILAKIPIELIRDCACAYESFSDKCLQEDKLWYGFNNCYSEYIDDISQERPSFAFKVITSSRGSTLLADTYRFSIFRAAYPQILIAIQEKTPTDEQIQYLAAYLLRYRSVISEADFAKVQKIKEMLNNDFGANETYKILMNLIIGKFLLQGLYKEGQELITSTKFEILNHILNFTHAEVTEENIQEAIANLAEDDVDEAEYLLSNIPKTSPCFVQVKMVFGHAFMDQEEHLEAGKCFLEAASETKIMRRDILMLAATCLLVKSPEDSEDQIYLPREEAKSRDIPLSPLQIQECQELASDEAKFFSLLRDLYKNYPEIQALC